MNPPIPQPDDRRPADAGAGGGAPERLEDLLADRAVQGLEAAADAELARLLARAGGGAREGESLERAAAALDMALGREDRRVSAGAMPAALRARLSALGDQWAAERRRVQAGGLRLVGEGGAAGTVGRSSQRTRGRAVTMSLTWGGWMVAAASLALAAWVTVMTPTPARNGGGTIASAGEGLSPNEGLALLEARGEKGGAILAVRAADERRGLEAELRLDPETREGYLAIAGLDVTDQSDVQYQVWVLDAGRDHPVDGGTFDIRDVQEGAKVIVPVRSRLALRQPVGFAVSAEPRGGVVVPRADHIVVRAALPAMGPMPEWEDGPGMAP